MNPAALKSPAPPRLFTFVGGSGPGPWAVQSMQTLVGETLPAAACLRVEAGPPGPDATAAPWARWALWGVTSNDRYVERHEKTALANTQAALGRAQATRAALIPIRKSPRWWALTQDERRAVFEEQSRHIAIGLRYLPAVARRLHHCRDLGIAAPFDFLTWFDYAPEHEAAFDDLLATLRTSAEWAYVDREVDIRLVRVA